MSRPHRIIQGCRVLLCFAMVLFACQSDQSADNNANSGGGNGGQTQRGSGGNQPQGAGGAPDSGGTGAHDPSMDPTDVDEPVQRIIDDIDDPVLIETPNAKLVYSQNFDGLRAGDTWLNACKWKKHVRVEATCGLKSTPCLHVKHDPFTKEPPLFPLPPENDRPPYPPGSTGQCFPYYTNTATDVLQDVVELPYAAEYSLSYDIYFEPGYDWSRGGKLPGLSAKEWDSGCSIVGDGLRTDPGAARWSVRVMWREDGAAELYVYEQSRTPGLCGARLRTKMPFVTGQWRGVTVYVKLNSSATAKDGIAQVYFDGKLAQSITGMRFRATTTKASLIRHIFFSTFFGGNEEKRLFCQMHPADPMYCQPADPKLDITWVPRDVAHVMFDNVAVHAGLRVRKGAGL
ncbi:MAG: hypothetical protein SF187_01025 [Deltaproteobacteria bacterium]|nr:hypothetical protein [Deltaproteobacteria bacterium]